MHLPTRLLSPTLLLTLLPTLAYADIKLPAIFSDHMVLQANQPVKVWGTTTPNTDLTLTINDTNTTTKSDPQGHFTAHLPPLKPSTQPTDFTVSNANAEQVKITDVLVGQVWLGSGQSNMGMTVDRAANARQFIADANHPQIRLYTVPRAFSPTPPNAFPDLAGDRSSPGSGGKWLLCSPDTLPPFSAVLYHFGLTLHDQLHQPVGLVHASWGGTPIQPWTPLEAFTPEQQKEEHAKAVKFYGTPPATTSSKPVAPPKIAHFLPASLYNGMIAPYAGYSLAGVVWYQGENNVHQRDSDTYADRFATMSKLWREHFDQPDLPFYFVQLAPYQGYSAPREALPKVWEQQLLITQRDPHAFIAPTSDVTDLKNIHPANKHTVGQRLADLALTHTYHQENLPHQSPTYASSKVEGDKLRIHFNGAPEGLSTRDNAQPDSFELAGPDGVYHAAHAQVDGSDILLSSDEVTEPKSARFAWSPTATPNLQNKAGWPALPFRTNAPSK